MGGPCLMNCFRRLKAKSGELLIWVISCRRSLLCQYWRGRPPQPLTLGRTKRGTRNMREESGHA